MSLINITTKILNSENYNEKKILASDINQIKGALQSGTYDIKPNNIYLEGNTITADSGQNWIRRNGNTFQFYNGSSWQEPSTATLLTFTAGENIAARDVVYLKVSDGKIYKASSTNNDWIGVATAAITSGASGTVYPNGSLVGGFSGLTPGTWYKVNASAGTINASDLTIANVKYNVGVAISATQIILIKNQLNGITNEVNRKGVIHRKVYSSAAEVTRDAESWADTAKTFTLSAPVNSLITCINIVGQLKSQGSSYAGQVCIKLDGTNLGTKYIVYENMAQITGNDTFVPMYSSSESALLIVFNENYTYVTASITQPLKVLDASTTFMVRLNGQTTALKNVVIEVIYVENFEED